jgi:hypothetical protein
VRGKADASRRRVGNLIPLDTAAIEKRERSDSRLVASALRTLTREAVAIGFPGQLLTGGDENRRAADVVVRSGTSAYPRWNFRKGACQPFINLQSP